VHEYAIYNNILDYRYNLDAYQFQTRLLHTGPPAYLEDNSCEVSIWRITNSDFG